MKIRKLTTENYPKAYALLRQAFPGSLHEMQVMERLHRNAKIQHEWVCIHINSVIGHIAFTNAYNGSDVCGLHLAPIAVKPEFQRQGVGSELLRFALRQPFIKDSAIFVSGDADFFGKFGFEPCLMQVCQLKKRNSHFLGLRNKTEGQFTVGYEPEFFR